MRRFPRTLQKTLVSSFVLQSTSLSPSRAFLRQTIHNQQALMQKHTYSHVYQHYQHPEQKCHCRLFSSSSEFSPAPPPGTHGTPVFDNVDFAVLQDDSILFESTKRNADPEAVFVVTGASRGIGLQFVKSLLERCRGKIIACCRAPTPELTALMEESSSRVEMVTLDLEDQGSIAAAGKQIRDTYDRADALFNVAGILHDGTPNSPGPERALTKIDREWFEKTLAVNLLGPVMWTQELTPLLAQRRRSSKDQSVASRPKAVVVNLSARVGSISDNGLGGWYSYRMSKTALNQFTRTAALELKRSQAWVIAVHPGTTATGLSEPFQKNVKEGSLFPVGFTVQQLLNVVDALEEKHSGGLYDWSGQALSF